MFQKNDDKNPGAANWSRETVIVVLVVIAFVLYSRYVPTGANVKEWVEMFIYGVVIVIACIVIWGLIFGKRYKLKAFMQKNNPENTITAPQMGVDPINAVEVKNFETLKNLSLIFSSVIDRMEKVEKEEFLNIFKSNEVSSNFYWEKYLESNRNFVVFFQFIDNENRIRLLDYLLNKKA